MEFIVLPTMYLLGVWLYGFMLRDVEPGSSRENTMFRFRCWFSVMKIGRTTGERLGDVEIVEHA